MSLKKLNSILFLLIVLTSCYVNNSKIRSLKIKEASDSTDAIYTQLFIFKKGKPVIDTFADIQGKFDILLSKDIKKITFLNVGDYPLTLSRRGLLRKRIIFLEKSNDNVYDKVLYKKTEKLLVHLLRWNHKVGNDSVSFGLDHPNDIYYYKNLNFLKTKVKVRIK